MRCFWVEVICFDFCFLGDGTTFLKTAPLKSDPNWNTDTKRHENISKCCQVLRLWYKLHPKTDMNSHAKIIRCTQQIRSEHEGPRTDSSLLEFYDRAWIEDRTAEYLSPAAGLCIIIWLASRQDNVLKEKLFSHSPVHTSISAQRWQLSWRIYEVNWAGFVADASQGVWQRVGKLPCLACQGWKPHSSTVRREHLCFGEWTMFVLRRSNRLPAAVWGDRLCHGPSTELDRDGGEWKKRRREGGNPCIESCCRNRAGKSSFLCFANTDLACPAISAILWITHLPFAFQGCILLQLRETENWIFHI